MDRATLLERLADLIVSVEKSHPVPLDGVDAAGEDNFGRRARRSCGATWKTSGSSLHRPFHRPRAERCRRGQKSPEG